MSGRHHHYLPQFIQRSFAYRRSGKQFYVHANHCSLPPYTPNTKGLGQELDFYGGPEDTALDAAITSGEDALAATIQAINQGLEVSAIDMATLVSALAFRTKSMREAIVGMFPALLAALRARLVDTSRLRRDLVASLTDPNESRRLINEEINKRMRHLPREQRGKASYALQSRWKAHVAEQEERLVSEARQWVYVLLAEVRVEANAIAHGAYLHALAKDPSMVTRAQLMAGELTFSVLDAPPGEFFILGDCGPIAIFTDGKPRLVLGALDKEAQIETVLLPVSPARCVVGRLPTATEDLSVADINHISASLSLEFFVSDRNDGLDGLRTLIGSLVPFETAEDIIEKLGSEPG